MGWVFGIHWKADKSNDLKDSRFFSDMKFTLTLGPGRSSSRSYAMVRLYPFCSPAIFANNFKAFLVRAHPAEVDGLGDILVM